MANASQPLVGLVGWRGMVGSVLMDRMQAEGDFGLIEPVFFSTSNAGGKAPAWAKNETTLQDAHDIEALKKCEIVVTAQGGDYTSAVFPKLRAAGWNGHWIDAASTLRMEGDAVIVLDPVNLPVIQNALAKGGSCAEVMRQFTTTAAFDEHLRIVLSRMYQHNTSWLPVIDGEGVYLGEVTQESIADYLSSGR